MYRSPAILDIYRRVAERRYYEEFLFHLLKIPIRHHGSAHLYPVSKSLWAKYRQHSQKLLYLDLKKRPGIGLYNTLYPGCCKARIGRGVGQSRTKCRQILQYSCSAKEYFRALRWLRVTIVRLCVSLSMLSLHRGC